MLLVDVAAEVTITDACRPVGLAFEELLAIQAVLAYY
jgi:hypothetical protein